MPDRLRSMINKHDRDNARVHRLTGEPVMAPRGDSNVKRVCGSCWHMVDEVGEVIRWTKQTERLCGCDRSGSWMVRPRGWQHWSRKEHRTIIHDFPGVVTCPTCGADALGEVTM